MTDDFKRTLGMRVRAAREARGLTQEYLSAALGFKDRQSLSAIEQGLRALKAEELVILSRELKTSLDFFTDPFTVAGEARFCWRTRDHGVDLERLEAKIGPLVGLVRQLCRDEASGLKHSLRLSPKSSTNDALAAGRSVASLLRREALRSLPAEPSVERLRKQIRSVLEFHVLFLDLPRAVTGMTCELADQTVVVVNAKLPLAEQYQDLALGLFYALCFDAVNPPPEIYIAPDGYASANTEKLALSFALGLLVPASVLEDLQRSRSDTAEIEKAARSWNVAPSLLLRHVSAHVKGKSAQPRKKAPNGAARATADLLSPPCSATAQAPSRMFEAGILGKLHVALSQGAVSARKVAKLLSMRTAELKLLFENSGFSAPFDL